MGVMYLLTALIHLFFQNSFSIDTSSSCAACGATSYYYQHYRNLQLNQSRTLVKREAEATTLLPYIYRITIKGHLRRRIKIKNSKRPEGISRDMYLDAKTNMDFIAMFNPYERIDQFSLLSADKDHGRQTKGASMTQRGRVARSSSASNIKLEELLEEAIDTSNYGSIDASNFGSINENCLKSAKIPPWQKFITEHDNPTIVCPGIAVNLEYLISSRTCLYQLDPLKLIAYHAHPNHEPPDQQEMAIELELSKNINKHPTFAVDLALVKAVNVESIFCKSIQPLCASAGVKGAVFPTGMRFSWLWYRQSNVNRTFAVVAEVLGNNLEECKIVRNNKNMICVRIEDDGGQCDDDSINSGYLSHYLPNTQDMMRADGYNGLHLLYAVYSKGAKTCNDAKKNVAYFSRVDLEWIWLFEQTRDAECDTLASELQEVMLSQYHKLNSFIWNFKIYCQKAGCKYNDEVIKRANATLQGKPSDLIRGKIPWRRRTG